MAMALGILSAFGIGALVAILTAAPSPDRRVVSRASDATAGTAVAQTGPGNARSGSVAEVIPPSADAPSPQATGRIHGDRSSPEPAGEPTPGPSWALDPVRWSADLASAYEIARERHQLVLLFAVPSAET